MQRISNPGVLSPKGTAITQLPHQRLREHQRREKERLETSEVQEHGYKRVSFKQDRDAAPMNSQQNGC